MQDPINSETRELAKLLWDYQRLDMPVEPADVIIAMGCEDGRVAERAAQLCNDGFAKWVVCTGRSGDRTKAMLHAKGFSSEAAYFADIVGKAGVPTDRILIEDQATNSGENIAYTKKLFAGKGIDAKHIIVVTAPYAERRQQSTYAAQWPNQKITITSPQLTFDTYPTGELTANYLINALVGRVQRMKTYGERGFQAKSDIPQKIWAACNRLIELGYTEQLVK